MYQPFSLLNRVSRTLRLIISLIIGAIIFILCRPSQSGAISFMYAWIGFSLSILIFSWTTILINETKNVAMVATEQDSSRLIIFLVVVTAAFISLFAVILLLRDIPTYNKRGLSYHILLSIVAVSCSWLLVHTIFTLRYAHLYYTYPTHEAKANADHCGGLQFPDDETPDLLDFAYFSFVLGMTFQVSDVMVTSKRIRRLVLIHGLLSFVYNTAIVALTINILSGIIGSR